MTRKTNTGFTLIELMVVMGIMVLVTTIAVSGYFGMSRASSYVSARTVVRSVLQTAAQRACMDGRRVVVAFVARQDDANYKDNALIAIEAAGTVTEDVKYGYIEDRTAHLTHWKISKDASGKKWGAVEVGAVATIAVWNLRNGASFHGFKAEVKTDTTEEIPGETGDDETYTYPVTRLTPSKNSGFQKKDWAKGDQYGFQITDVQYVPTGFKIGSGSAGSSPKKTLLVFEPDGSGFVVDDRSSWDGEKTSKTKLDLYLYEVRKDDAAIKVVFDDGKVKEEL